MTIPAILLREHAGADRGDDRGADRYRVRFGALRLDQGPHAPELTIHDVSASGFLLETDQELAIGSGIIVELPNAICKDARIVWATNNFYGAEFSNTLARTELARIIAASPVVWADFGDERNVEPAGRRERREDSINYDEGEIEADGKLPLTTRVRIIFGSAACLWAMIATSVWLVIG